MEIAGQAMSEVLLFGGTFNPVHVGHLRVAIEVAETLRFERVDWIPSYAPRHKQGGGLLPFDLRVALLRAAIGGQSNLAVNEIEKTLPVPSVTIRTLEAIARTAPEAERYFMLGDREFLRLPKWVRGREVIALSHIAVLRRTETDLDSFAAAVAEAWPQCRRIEAPAGAVAAFELTPGRKAVLLSPPRIEISSSLVRQRWLEGRNLRHILPDGVIDLLDAHRDVVEAAWKVEAEFQQKARGQ
jgi:nicotinate-nucleotide adenylyltransferase